MEPRLAIRIYMPFCWGSACPNDQSAIDHWPQRSCATAAMGGRARPRRSTPNVQRLIRPLLKMKSGWTESGSGQWVRNREADEFGARSQVLPPARHCRLGLLARGPWVRFGGLLFELDC